MTYVDREKDARAEDTLLRADTGLRAARRVGGNQIEMILSTQAGAERNNGGAAPSSGEQESA